MLTIYFSVHSMELPEPRILSEEQEAFIKILNSQREASAREPIKQNESCRKLIKKMKSKSDNQAFVAEHKEYLKVMNPPEYYKSAPIIIKDRWEILADICCEESCCGLQYSRACCGTACSMAGLCSCLGLMYKFLSCYGLSEQRRYFVCQEPDSVSCCSCDSNYERCLSDSGWFKNTIGSVVLSEAALLWLVLYAKYHAKKQQEKRRQWAKIE